MPKQELYKKIRLCYIKTHMMLSEFFLLHRYIKGYFEESEMKYISLINII